MPKGNREQCAWAPLPLDWADAMAIHTNGI